MTFTEVTGEVGLQGTLPLSYECSGTIYKGQAVRLCGTMKVKAPGATPAGGVISGCVGIAEYKQTDGQWIGVYGPGTICYSRISGTTGLVGEYLAPVGAGLLEYHAAQKPCSGNVGFIALETQATTIGLCRVLIK